MKKLLLIVFSFLLTFGALSAQSSPSLQEKTAANIRSKTEADVRKLFESNGFKVLNFMKGYPECLHGYVIFSDYMEFKGKSMTMPSSKKVFTIENQCRLVNENK